MLLLIYATISTLYESAYWEPGKWLFNTFGGSTAFKTICTTTILAHALEALYVQRLFVKHLTGFATGVSVWKYNFLIEVDILINELTQL